MKASISKVAFALLISVVPAASALGDESSQTKPAAVEQATRTSSRGIIDLPPIICIGTRQQPLASLQVSRMAPEISISQLALPAVFERIETAIYGGVFEQ
jgi:hypothetical protein